MLSAQFTVAATGKPSDILNLLPADPPRPRFDIFAAKGDSVHDPPPSQDRNDSAPTLPESQLPTQSKPQADPLVSVPVVSVVARPELKALCENMDGNGLRKYINDNPKERELIRLELPDAIRVAPDPGLMVLEAVEGFYGVNSHLKGNKNPELCGFRRACVLLLEVLMGINVDIGSEVREKAKTVAFEWKQKVKLDEESSFEALGLLHLVAAYGLGCEFEKNDLVEYFVIVAKYRQSTLLCKVIGLGDKVQDLVQKLIDNGKHLLAVKYVFELQLTSKYPPVPILETYVKESNKIAMKICEDGKNSLKSQNEATAKEIGALKAVIKVIEERKLESEYPKGTLEKRIEQLEKQKANRKRPAPAPAAKPQQQQRNPQQGGKKRSRPTASVGHSPPSLSCVNSTVPLVQQPHIQPAGLMPDNSAAYLNTAPGPYSLVGSSPAVAPYAGSSAGLYGLTGGPMGFPGSSNHATSHFYNPEQHMPSGHYDRSTAYGGYGVPPQYQSSYYPQ